MSDSDKILIVSATEAEAAPLREMVAASAAMSARVEWLVTGVGLMHTTFALTQRLNERQYLMAVQIGVGGSFTEDLPNGTVTQVARDRVADLGAEDGTKFLDIHQLALQNPGEPPYEKGWLENPFRHPALEKLPEVTGISVNRVHGEERGIEAVIKRLNPGVESMEGAAFFYVCLKMNLPCLQLRAVSNRVERRNRDKWELPKAILSLTEETWKFLNAVIK